MSFNITLSDLDYEKLDSFPNSVRESWSYGQHFHSVDDQPSVIINHGREFQWHDHGLRHRDEKLGPAWIKYNDDLKTIFWQVYYQNNNIHRANGPAYISKTETKWYKHSLIHRVDGPAIIKHTSTADIFCWAYNGEIYSNINEWAEKNSIDPEVFVYLKLQYT